MTDRKQIARWVEAKALKLRGERKTFEEIADQITRMGRGELPGRPAGLNFPTGYIISHQGVQKAIRCALARVPRRSPLRGRKFRGGRDHPPDTQSARIRRARWIEQQALALQREGYRTAEIADRIGRIGRGESPGLTPGLGLPRDFRISRQGIEKALRRIVYRDANRAAEKFQENEDFSRWHQDYLRSKGIERLDGMLLALSPDIERSKVRAIREAVAIIRQQAERHGFIASSRKRRSDTGKTKPRKPVNPAEAQQRMNSEFECLHEFWNPGENPR